MKLTIFLLLRAVPSWRQITRDPQAYYFAIEVLRDSALIAGGYCELLEIIPSYEKDNKAYEAAHVA